MSGVARSVVIGASALVCAAISLPMAAPASAQNASGNRLAAFCAVNHRERAASLGAQIGAARGGERGAQIGAAIGAARGARLDAMCRQFAADRAMPRAAARPPAAIASAAATTTRAATQDGGPAAGPGVGPPVDQGADQGADRGPEPGRVHPSTAAPEASSAAANRERCMVSAAVSFPRDGTPAAPVMGRVCESADGRFHEM